LFRNVNAMNEGMVSNSTPKLVAMATSLERSDKGLINKYDQMPTIWVEIGPVDPQIIGEKLTTIKIKKKH